MKKLDIQSYDRTVVLGALVVVIAMILSLPWLGLGNFYTRGEPREALVAVAMMQQDNYILPFFQGDFAFKPPMLHWLVVACSLPQGFVSETSARLPSALALIVMALVFFRFTARRTCPSRAFIATTIMLTCFEVHRAAMTCRVDMVLMAFMVCEILALFRWYERGLKGMPWLAALLASGAILTKGPVGVLLPAMALGLFLLADGRGLKAAVVCGIKLAIPSLVLPALWYLAAYRQGGEEFWNLVLEENVGRFLGKMSYESHEHGPFYTIPMLLSGLLPFTLLLIFCLPVLKYRSQNSIMERIKNGIRSFRNLDAWHRYAAIVAALIFVFYCIPKSKRGVYLLPMYPFVAMMVADAMMWAYDRHRRVVSAFSGTMTAIAALMAVAMSAIRFIDPQMLGTSRSARRMASQLAGIQAADDSALYIASIALLVAAIVVVIAMRRHRYASIVGALLPWICATIAIDAAINPAIKNSVPDYDFAMKTRTLLGGNPAYYFCADDMEENVFTVDFYLDDRVEEFHSAAQLPDKGYIFFKEHNLAKIDSVMSGIDTQKVLETPNEFTCFKGKIYLYRFEK